MHVQMKVKSLQVGARDLNIYFLLFSISQTFCNAKAIHFIMKEKKDIKNKGRGGDVAQLLETHMYKVNRFNLHHHINWAW